LKVFSLNLFDKSEPQLTSEKVSKEVVEQPSKLAPKAKYLLIADAVRYAIKKGQLAPSEPLPSARKLAEQLKVNRHTVMAALAELVAQGWVEAKERSGYRVVDCLPIQSSRILNDNFRETNKNNYSSLSNIPDPETGGYGVENTPVFSWKFRREISLPSQPKKKASEYLYNFSGGYPDISRFPFDEFKGCFNQFCQRPKKSSLSYGDSVGEKELLDQISTYLRRVRAITDKELLICNGSQEGLYMVAQLLLQTGDKVAVEELGYPPSWAAFENTGAELVAIKQDHKGLIPEHLAEQLALGDIKVIYLTPLHQYPTTVTLEVSRRMQIYQLAVQYGVAIIEDDYDHEFHYNTQPIAPMAADDPIGLVIYISTFSKLMFGGAGIGYISADSKLINQLAIYKSLVNHKTNVLIQQTVAKWMKYGGFESHLRRMTRVYQKRRDHMVSLLESYKQQGFPITFESPAGGMALWVNMGKSVMGLKGSLQKKDVFLATEIEFKLTSRLNVNSKNPSYSQSHKAGKEKAKPAQAEYEQYRYIRLGFAGMTEEHAKNGVALIFKVLYGSKN
jgi:GntR family transcriptional regulator/MocR family aminotransferase